MGETMREAITELVVRVGSRGREYRHCDNCGSRLSEWFVDSRYYGQKGMKCFNCGEVSEYEEHPPVQLEPWARKIVRRLHTEEDQDG